MNNADRPIMPIIDVEGDVVPDDQYGIVRENFCSGLTKMEYFAGLAMQGMIAKHGGLSDELIEDAVDIAASLLIALEG